MPANLAPGVHRHLLASLVLIAGLLATWFAYAPGLGGSLQFDDYDNLGGLAAVHDSASAFRFVATGSAGPLGRPLALATFVPQSYAWPDTPEVFLHTNILIHLLNGVLVTWFLYLLGQARRQPERQAALIAASAGTLWMLIPLLASSSLFIVQRMTTLAAVFTLLGAVAYMYARRGIDRRPVIAMIGMTLSLGAGALLAALAKENGILLLLFILAAEAALLDRPSNISRRLWRQWFGLVLIVPIAVLLIYLATRLPYSEGIVLRRDFTGIERLATQAGVLWKYLYLAFLPSIPSLGPFHDHYPVQRSLLSFAVLLSTGAWLAVIGVAVVLRQRVPLLVFAVAWYLFGHLLESTTISLELYFEHRNYLPLVGPIYALIASLAELEKKWRRLAVIGTTVYAGLLASVLFSTTSLWGSPALAAEMWHIHNPASLRAAQHLARGLEREGDPFSTRRLLNRYVEANPDAHGVRLQILAISCQLEPESDFGEEVSFLEKNLPDMQFDHSVGVAFQQLYGLVRERRCPTIDDVEIYRIGQSLLENPRFNMPIVRHNIHAVMARIGIDRRDFGLAMTHMEEALRAYHNPDTLLVAIGILNTGGRHDVSWDLLAEARDRTPPRHPLRARQWQRELDRIQGVLLALERHQEQSP